MPKNVEKLGGAPENEEKIYDKVRDQELRRKKAWNLVVSVLWCFQINGMVFI